MTDARKPSVVSFFCSDDALNAPNSRAPVWKIERPR